MSNVRQGSTLCPLGFRTASDLRETAGRIVRPLVVFFLLQPVALGQDRNDPTDERASRDPQAQVETPADQSAPDTAPLSDRFARVLRQRCMGCHGRDGVVEGEVNLQLAVRQATLHKSPELLAKLVDALDQQLMPPADESALKPALRKALVDELKGLLRQSLVRSETSERTPIRRMNRFQYNNAVQDLFELQVEVFSLPERMLRDHSNYFQPASGRMPDQVRVGSRPLGKSQLIERRLDGVAPFPQDLRAEHGFDNQADHLSLSPLLLESFLRLGRSIVSSHDFNAKTCGIWERFFAEPAVSEAGSPTEVVRERLEWFLTRAFRRPVAKSEVERYVDFVTSAQRDGTSFTDSMREAAAAALASPRFLYLYDVDPHSDASLAEVRIIECFNLASRLSFFLWGSLPDEQLLELAQAGTLRQPQVLRNQVDRMLKDHRLKRFCDSFPSQWLQLENIISSTPDPLRYPQFYFAKYRASMHMMLEPLLLFETVLIENRPITELLDPDFSYRSDLLTAWYRDGSQGKAGAPTVVSFRRVPVTDRRQGGVITNAAVMTMTSGPQRTKPITRGAWLATVILNDPPQPPPADVPPLADMPAEDEKDLTIRERFAAHRTRADCAGCHQKIDPLGFALENFDAAGIWRDRYENGQPVDSSGILLGRHQFTDVVEFKDALLHERERFVTALCEHLLAFALGRALTVEDSLAIERIVEQSQNDEHRFHAVLRQIVLSRPFRMPSTRPQKSNSPHAETQQVPAP